MLRNTFCHIPGIGLKTELQLWAAGIHSWDQLPEAAEAGFPVSRGKLKMMKQSLERSIVRLAGKDPAYFADLLPSEQHWRLFPHFRDATAYLDIETTGMGTPQDSITTIALYDGRSVSTYVQGRNLDRFQEDIQKYSIVVTYNGKCFDIPFIRSVLGVPMNQAHIDLRYVLKSLGYRGGLKGCEKQLGIDRKELDGVDGFFAVLLWNDYRRGRNPKALETLLAYNALDAVHLEALMVFAYNRKLEKTPFHHTHVLASPSAPDIPYKPDLTTIERLKASWYPGM